MELEYLEIEKDLIPYKFTITIKNTILKFIIRYNPIGDYFTADIFDKDDSVIAYAQKFIMGGNLFKNIYDERLPAVEIIPYDPSGENERITFDNFGEAVKPYIFGVVS